jgi:hypothetical protein
VAQLPSLSRPRRISFRNQEFSEAVSCQDGHQEENCVSVVGVKIYWLELKFDLCSGRLLSRQNMKLLPPSRLLLELR